MTTTGDTPPNERLLPPRKVLADDVYEVLKDWLLSGHIEPGSRVKIDRISAQLDISNTPVRQALGRLEADGLVYKQPYRGFVAASMPDRKIISDMYEFRLLIEPQAAAKAAASAKPQDIAFLEEQSGAEGNTVPAGRLDAIAMADERFHARLAELADNGIVAETLEKLLGRSRSFRVFYSRHGAIGATREEHRQIIRAVANGDAAGAQEAMAGHLAAAAERMLRTLD